MTVVQEAYEVETMQEDLTVCNCDFDCDNCGGSATH
jgi:hypothetical protein